MFGWATQIAKTAVSEAASLGKAYVDTVIGDDETDEEYYARIAREREAHARGGGVGENDQGSGSAVPSTQHQQHHISATNNHTSGGTPSSGGYSVVQGGGATTTSVQRIGEMPTLHKPTNPTTTNMQSSSSLNSSSTLGGPRNTTSSPAPLAADSMLRHNRFTGGAGKKVGLNKGLGVTRGLAAAPPISSTTAAPISAAAADAAVAPTHQPTVQRMCDDGNNNSIASYPMDASSQSGTSPVVSTPTRTHKPFVPSPSASSTTLRKPISSSQLSSSGLRPKREEPASTFAAPPLAVTPDQPATATPTPVEDPQDTPSPATMTPTTPVSASSFTVIKPTLTTTGLTTTRKPAVARKTGLGLGGGSTSIKTGLGLGGVGIASKLGTLRAAPPLSLSSTVASTTPQDDDMRDEEKATVSPEQVVPTPPTAVTITTLPTLNTSTAQPIDVIAAATESPPKSSSVMAAVPSPIWSGLDQHYARVGTTTTTSSTIRSTFLGAYEALIEVAFLANDDASSPHTLKEVYARTIECVEKYPATTNTSALITTLSSSPSPLPKMGNYLTSLQKLFDAINNIEKECVSITDENMDAVMMGTFVASMEAISELAEHFDVGGDDATTSGSNHYTCMRDALSTQERILLDAAVIAKQRGEDEESRRCKVAVPLLVLTQKLLWAM